MLLKYFYDDKLAQASYLVGCPATGTAAMIDPGRNIQPYLRAAEANDLVIETVVETHIHADYASGGRELAHHTGATLTVSGHGREENSALAYDLSAAGVTVKYVFDGDQIMVGNVRLGVIHTPGHTPEHIVLMLTDHNAPQPMGIFSGDFLFAGDIGRPDLLEEALKVANTREAGARQQFANIHKFRQMPPHLQIWPGHGAGSACGKALGAVPSSTLGYEILVSPAFQFDDEAAFVDWLLTGQPEAPRYFAQMKTINRVGPTLLDEVNRPLRLGREDFQRVLEDSDLLIDARPAEAYTNGHVPGTLHIPGAENLFSTYAGWYVDYDKPVYLLAEKAHIADLVMQLRAIGVDYIPGYFTPEVISGTVEQIRHVSAQQAADLQQQGAFILDVRGHTEREEQYIPGSVFIPMGAILAEIDTLPKDRLIIVQCGGGVRSMIVTSLLKNHGFAVANLTGGIDAWIAANQAVEQPDPV